MTNLLPDLAHARRSARVALCEANPSSTRRLAGEWLHPPAIRVLRDFGTDLPSASPEHSAVLSAEAFEGAANGVRGRRTYDRGDWFLVGDAVGYHHPLTVAPAPLDRVAEGAVFAPLPPPIANGPNAMRDGA